MKKIFSLILAIVMMFSITVAFASCGISDDPSKVREELKEEGYAVEVLDSYSDFNEYHIYDICEHFDISLDYVHTIILASTKRDNTNPVIVFFCDSRRGAKTVENDIKAATNDSEFTEELKEFVQEGLDLSSLAAGKLKRSGSAVAYGHADIVNILNSFG